MKLVNSTIERVVKKCPSCGSTKPLQDFYVNASCPDGRNNLCSACCKLRAKKRAERLKSEGLCVYCNQPARENKLTCKDCEAKRQKERKIKYANLKKSGICQRHGCKNPTTNGQCFCYVHAEENKNQNREFIQRCANFLGGKCQICGLETPRAWLYDFHHVDPKNKKRPIGAMPKSPKTFTTKVIPELNKCCLLCRACHQEVTMGNVPLRILDALDDNKGHRALGLPPFALYFDRNTREPIEEHAGSVCLRKIINA